MESHSTMDRNIIKTMSLLRYTNDIRKLWDAFYNPELFSSALIQQAIAQNPITDTSLLVEIYNKGHIGVKRTVVVHKNTPIKITLEALNGDYEPTKRAAVSHPSITDKDILPLLEIDRKPSPVFGMGIILNHNLNGATIEKAYRNIEWGEHNLIAQTEILNNPNAPLSILKELAEGADYFICSKMVEMKLMPESFLLTILHRFSKYNDVSLLIAIHSNVQYSEDIASIFRRLLIDGLISSDGLDEKEVRKIIIKKSDAFLKEHGYDEDMLRVLDVESRLALI